MQAIDLLFKQPKFISAPFIKRELGITMHAAINNLEKLVQAGILIESTGKQRNRSYNAPAVIEILQD